MPTRPDDPSIPRDALLWRGILKEWIQQMPDGTSRPQSLAFIDGSESREVSFFIAAETTLERVSEGRPFARVAQVPASLLRELGYNLARDPEGANGDLAHVVACPNDSKKRKDVERDAKRIKQAATWVDAAST